jgi:iron(III) transport system permease protein
MTEEGQRLSYETWKTDLHFLPGSRMGGMVDGYLKQNVPFKRSHGGMAAAASGNQHRPQRADQDPDNEAVVRPPDVRCRRTYDPSAAAFGDLLPATMLLAVISTSFIILCHLVAVLWLSWSDGTPGTGLTYTSANYTEVFSDQRTYRVLLDTFAFAFVSLIVALGIGVPIAWIAERTDFRAKTLLFTLMAVGLLIPGFAVAMGWLFLLHPRIGMLNQLFQTVFGLSSPFSITTILGMGWVQGLNLAPLAFIMTAAVFRSMDPSLEEAAEVHGAGALRVLRRITVRLAWPGILAASIYVFMTAFAAFDVPAIIGWGNRIFTFSTYLYLLLNPQDVLPRYGLAAALSPSPRDRRAGKLVVWSHAAALAPLRCRHRTRLPAEAQAARAAAPSAPGDSSAPICCSVKIMPILLLAYASGCRSSSCRAHCLFDHVADALRHPAMGPGVSRGRQYHDLAVLVPTVTLAISLAFSWVVLRSRIPGRAGFDFHRLSAASPCPASSLASARCC